MDPADLKYSVDHEWISVTDGIGRVGITDYAQQQLGDVVYVELPDVGKSFKQGEQFGSIEVVVNCAGIATGDRTVGRDNVPAADGMGHRRYRW